MSARTRYYLNLSLLGFALFLASWYVIEQQKRIVGRGELTTKNYEHIDKPHILLRREEKDAATHITLTQSTSCTLR